MTLRLLTLLTMTLSGTAHADFAPSVWEQMQNGGAQTITARIESLDISPSAVRVGYQEMVTDGSKSSMNLCLESLADHSMHEGWLSAVNNQRIESFRQALKSRELVELSFKGPWSPCLSSISAKK